jgi:cholesterol oxidase
VLRDGVRVDAIPIRARIEPSLMDGRPAIAVVYPADAPFPWPRVRDELRALGAGTLLGMTFHMPLAPPAGTPFLLHRC